MAEREHVYLLGKDGDPEPLAETPYKSEAALQELIADHPEVLAGEQMTPDVPRRWLLIRREMGIADSADSGDRWAVDHLLLDQDARPTLVEVKRSENSEIRRRIVGQMLDYAAHATRYWIVSDIRKRFETDAGSEDAARNQLALRLGVGSEPDEDTAAYEAFWERVDTNLRADNVRLLFVADRIPDELAHVVEFLNRHMPHIEVLAVELKQFQGKGVRALVPRVIGRTAKPRRGAGGGTLTLDAILGQFPEGTVREAARQLIERSRAAGATFEPGSRGTSIRGRCRLWGQPVTVAWLFPSEIGWMRTRHFSFGCGVPYDTLPSELGEVMRRYADGFRDPYTHDASSQGVAARYVEPTDAAKHIETLAGRVEVVLRELAEL